MRELIKALNYTLIKCRVSTFKVFYVDTNVDLLTNTNAEPFSS